MDNMYRLKDYKDKNVYHEALTVEELIDKVTKYHNDEYIRWSLENWTKEDFERIKVK